MQSATHRIQIMNNFIRPLFLAVLVCALWAPPGISGPVHLDYNFLEEVDVKKLPGDLVIRLKFKSPEIAYLSPKFFNKTVEIDFPGSRLVSESNYFPTQDSDIYQVYISQIDSGLIRLRLLLSQKMVGIEDQLRIKNDGRYLEIHVGKNRGDTLESLLARATRLQLTEQPEVAKDFAEQSRSPAESVKPVAPEVISNRVFLSPSKPVKRDPLLLSQIVGKGLQGARNAIADDGLEITNEAGLFQNGKVRKTDSLDMVASSWKMFYTLIFVLAAMFFLFYLFKKFVWKNGGLGGSGKSVKVLSTGFLGPKKSLALVEIPGEILVLGIADGHISLLSNIRDEEKIAMIKGVGDKKSKGINKHDENLSNEPQSKNIDGGVDVYTQRLVKNQSSHRFSEHLRRSSHRQATQDHTLQGVTSMIRDNLGKIETV